ncbi:MAG TPA: PHP-associated domain-containing protein [Vicinamibacterales bacterium]
MPLKVELHAHTSDDPFDAIPHSSIALLDRAAALGYQALAITLHDKQIDLGPLRAHAEVRGLVLIPGIERTIEGKHVLLLNFSARAEGVTTFEALARLRSEEPGLVVAPHPFYPLGSSLGKTLDRFPALFDAVEVNAMHARGADFNQAAIRWAAAHGKPLVGNGDIHRLAQLGTTYSLVDAAPDAQAICDAIRAGRVEVRSARLGWIKTLTIFLDIVVVWLWRSAVRRARPGAAADIALEP